MQSNKVLYWLNTGIFPATVMFSCGFNYEEISKLLKQKKADDWLSAIEYKEHLIRESKYCAICVEFINKQKQQKKYFSIHIKETFKFRDWDYVALSHEILHICQFLLPDILDRNREYEAEAYLHSHLMQQCLNILRDKKEK